TTIIASTSFIRQNPTALTAFVHDSMRGLQYTLRNPAGAAQIVATAAKGKVSFFKGELGIYHPYWSDPALQKRGLGYMTAARGKPTRAVAVKSLGRSKPVPLNKLYTNAYLGAPVAP